ncbi:alpha/beta fold hydrolase [Roseateles amylovorans]|uniref:Alpha/beta hydrolase n=1 Tax=Roseateles amylovorans TaxID=2978473 RepID=A0ABY6AVJ6_9BURK|nr:alpha/beta hydrolase [Roseateles amylovorans]UXH77216.1 alpha/beta hydrolase [Roseateles amylovorans]
MTALVLLPGLDGTGDLFSPLLEALRDTVDTRLIRYPTHGPMDYAGHLAFARARLPTDEPFVLLGESFAGPVALTLAAEAPEGLRGLALCCTFARNPRPWLAGLRAFTRIAPVHHLPASLRDAMLLGRFGTPGLSRAMTAALNRVDANVLQSRLRAVTQVDVTVALSRISVPTLDLRATEDRLVPSSAAHLIRRALPSAIHADIEGPHALLQACPDGAATLLLSFLQRMASPILTPRLPDPADASPT